MPKGFFTQSAAVLFEKPPTLDALGAAYAMNPGEIDALKENCALYLVGRAR